MQGYDFSNLSKEAPLKSLTKGFYKSNGRNNQGRITSPHRGGGVNVFIVKLISNSRS